MKLVENRTTGKRHLPGDEELTLCGENLVVDACENATWVNDSWLDEFPQDYGDSCLDCSNCAEIADL